MLMFRQLRPKHGLTAQAPHRHEVHGSGVGFLMNSGILSRWAAIRGSSSFIQSVTLF
jgi:hypothetical protein